MYSIEKFIESQIYYKCFCLNIMENFDSYIGMNIDRYFEITLNFLNHQMETFY